MSLERANGSTLLLLLTHVRLMVEGPALYEALAEEAAEVAQAALKVARVMRNENPTPISYDEALANLSEEITDLSICADVLNIESEDELYMTKLYRWVNRLEDQEKELK